MAEKSFVGIVMWIVETLVALAVGFAMTDGTLEVPYIPLVVTQVAGWIVVIGIIIGVISAIVQGMAKE